MDRLKLFLRAIKTNKIYKNYVENLDINGSEAIFELGSHVGYLSRKIAEKLCDGGYLTCADVSDYYSNTLKARLKKFKNVNFCFGDIRKMNIDCEIYDKVILNDCLINLSKSERLSYLRFLLLVLKPNGSIHVRQPISQSGISSSEVRQLMRELGLHESKYKFDKSGKDIVFTGIFKKDN